MLHMVAFIVKPSLIYTEQRTKLYKLILTRYNLIKAVFFITKSWPQEGEDLERERLRDRGKENHALKYLCRMCGIPSCSPAVLFIVMQRKTFALEGGGQR